MTDTGLCKESGYNPRAGPIASNPADGNPTAEVFDSTARAYFAFIDFSDKELLIVRYIGWSGIEPTRVVT
jgi:hypothetical protein